uniref:Uncharacterized protein n=1 Tax=Sphaerodactylus townsendi TaxID=933632 RepID=A0ACB8FT00_9SAUR
MPCGSLFPLPWRPCYSQLLKSIQKSSAYWNRKQHQIFQALDAGWKNASAHKCDRPRDAERREAGGYIFSGMLAPWLHAISQYIPFYPIDDVYTGLCFQALGIRLKACRAITGLPGV